MRKFVQGKMDFERFVGRQPLDGVGESSEEHSVEDPQALVRSDLRYEDDAAVSTQAALQRRRVLNRWRAGPRRLGVDVVRQFERGGPCRVLVDRRPDGGNVIGEPKWTRVHPRALVQGETRSVAPRASPGPDGDVRGAGTMEECPRPTF